MNPPDPKQNEQLLRRKIRSMLKKPLPEDLHDEAVEALINYVLDNANSTPYLREEFKRYLCDYCGGLHPLSSCTQDGAVEYRINPTAWMAKHLPANVNRQLALSRGKFAVRGAVQKLDKTVEPSEVIVPPQSE